MRDETADERFLIKSIYLAKVFGRAQKKHVFGRRGYFRESHERKFERKIHVRYSSRTGFSDSLDVALFVKYYFDD